MPTPYKPERPNGGAQTPTEQRFVGAVEAVEHCLCGIVGLVLTGVVLGLSYLDSARESRPSREWRAFRLVGPEERTGRE